MLKVMGKQKNKQGKSFFSHLLSTVFNKKSIYSKKILNLKKKKKKARMLILD